MRAWLKMAALGFMFSTALGGMAWSQDSAREATTKMCWMEAHKEYPKNSGNDADNAALARDAYDHYAACMVNHGLQP
ncbi:hypothetical protein CR492_11705 [Methylocella silvestris]|uniref:Uncharacterized protein n=2 Tax=Methylocella silvestris TaxID=199596 RepID=A0A2J7TGA3_METSI|nr:hypothetical protein CR492_11705 [Methylocella silvestris]